jgi:flagellar biosynthesis protein FlhG
VSDQADKLREMVESMGVGPSMPAPPAPPASAARRQGRCKSIAVTSGKGGVGKTTLALVLGAGLAKLDKRVLLMDVDLGLANIQILLGIAPKFNIGHVVTGKCAIGDIVVEVVPNMFLAPGASGFEQLSNIDIGRFERLRADFMGLEENYDFLVMDTGAGIGNNVTGFARHADLVLLVMTPDPSSMADAYAMVKVLYDKGNTNVAVVVNMAANEGEGRGAFEMLRTMVEKFLKNPIRLYAILINEREVLRLGRKQLHLTGGGEGVNFYRTVDALARRLSGHQSQTAARGGFFSKLFGGA